MTPIFPKSLRTLVWVLFDSALLLLSLILSQVLRYSTNISYSFFAASLNLAPFMLLIALCTFWAFGFYRLMWQYATANDMIRIALATLFASLLTYLVSLIGHHFGADCLLHRMVYLLFWIISTALIGCSRLLYRMHLTKEFSFFRTTNHHGARRAMIIGASYTGANVIHEMQRGRYGHMIPIIAVDDDRIRTGAKLSGVPVVRGSGSIIKLVSDYAIDDIIIAIASPQSDLAPLMEKCISTGCRVKRVIPFENVSNHSIDNATLRDIDIGDLLGRPEERLDMTSVSAFLQEKTVLITGGGGSIGSELCRILLSLSPEKVILFDISENYMYDLYSSMRLLYGESLAKRLILRVGSVRDEKRLCEIFDEFHPHIVLHAAAHKHVPLMESSPCEAIKNNVFGTYLTAKTASTHGVERFVLISTDKAVNPTNVMGTTKHMAEMIIEAFNKETATEYIAVRFGNVLGSHGSVVPLFERQIKSGGPVTLTHPDIIRYFMTIPEAANLVLQAASMAKGGELFVLDMGQPMKIRELAQRMIHLYAPKDGPSIDIVYTGLRAGEKLYEELLLAGEGIAKTENEKIFIAKPEVTSMASIDDMIAQLTDHLNDSTALLSLLHQWVPTFQDPDVVNNAPNVATQASDSIGA